MKERGQIAFRKTVVGQLQDTLSLAFYARPIYLFEGDAANGFQLIG